MSYTAAFRNKLHLAQNGQCYWCSLPIPPNSTIDHLIPKALGGRKGDNLVLSCGRCNQEKMHLTPREFVKRRLTAFEAFVKSEGFKRYARR